MRAGRAWAIAGDALRQPALLLGCGLVGLAEVGTWLLVAPFLDGASRPAALGWLALQRLLLVAVLALFLPGWYAIARDRLAARAALGTFADRARESSQLLLVSMLVSRALALGLALVIALVALTLLGVVDTASVWTDAYLGLGLDRDLLALVGVPTAIVGAAVLARGVVGLQDLRAIEGEAPPASAPIWSLRVWRERWQGVAGYAIVRASLLAVPVLVALLVVASTSPDATSIEALSPVTIAASAVSFVGTTAVARAVLVRYQLATYDRVRSDEATASGSETAPAPRRRHVLLAGVLVLAAMVGVSAIRTVDVQPAPAEEFDVAPADATATIETAIERTGERDLIIDQTTDHWNDTTGAWMEGTRRQALLQRSDRSARYYADAGDVGDDRDRAIYATDGRLAMLHDPTPPASPGPHHVAIERRSWTILIGPPYGWGIEDRFAWPPADADWRLAEASDEVLVYESDDPSTLADHGLESVPDVPGDVALGEESGATIVIDRDLLTVRRATVTVDYVDDRDGASERVATRWEQRVIEIGDVTASRPGSVGPPSPPARLWDVVYY